MKKIIVLTVFIFFAAFIYAQDCSFYYPYKKGTLNEIKSFDKKGKHLSTNTTQVIENKQENGITTVKISSVYKAAKGDEEYQSEHSYVCEGDKFYFDMSSYLDNKTLASQGDMEINVEADKVGIPSNLEVGQTLDGGKVTATITNQGMKIMEMRVELSNRKVEAIETIETEAGSFECYKINQDIITKVGFMKMNTSSTEWLSKEVGVVKSESYNKNGKLMASTELTKLVQP